MTPDWVKHAVFYQIFPDRFAHSGQVAHQDEVSLKPWGTPPEEQGFQGGDLYGIVESLDYLDELGVTALYLNPIFTSAANHRYHTYDYFEVDPLLGGDEALRALLDAAHQRDIRIVLDGVFNHASRGFWPFHHVLENGPDSPYTDWFVIEDWPIRPYSSDASTPHNYAAWFDIPALPEFNFDHPPVRDFLLDVAKHWVNFGIDGWRLDVPADINDPPFWRAFRQVVKEANPDAYLVGELWSTAPEWVKGDRFDGLMNYPLLDAVLSFFGAERLRDYSKATLSLTPLDAEAFADDVDDLLSVYDWEVVCSQLNLLDSHDMARAQWIMGDDTEALRQAVLFLMTMPGAPCIYYGDEIGLSSDGDPYCREAFPDEASEWDTDLLAFYRDATALRHRHEVLRTGEVEWLHAGTRTVAFRRTLPGQEAIIAFNAGTATERVDLWSSVNRTAGYELVWPCRDTGTESRSRPGIQSRLSLPPRAARVWTRTS